MDDESGGSRAIDIRVDGAHGITLSEYQLIILARKGTPSLRIIPPLD